MYPTEPVKAGIDELSWLVGRWVSYDYPPWRETWNPIRDGVMKGRAQYQKSPTFAWFYLIVGANTMEVSYVTAEQSSPEDKSVYYRR